MSKSFLFITMLNSLPLTVFLVIVSTSFCLPQSFVAPPSTSTGEEQTVIELSKDKWQWMANKNIDKLESLFLPEAVFVHMSRTMNKEEELEVIRTGNIHYKNAEIEEVAVRVLGETAILLNKIRLTAEVRGNEVVNPFTVTEVYVKREGTWKLASLSFSRLAIQ